ncbi:MAG: PEP-CTERM sorting domain-containing protein [Acidobacteria bacterium]|nr:PEP-CTERM sorting domain-containing protein [Acidobacteriota bacterium]
MSALSLRLRQTALATLLFLPASLPAGVIVQNTVDDETAFTIVGKGTAYSTLGAISFGNYFSPSGFWFMSLTVDQGDDGGIIADDMVTVTGTIQHRKSPTGHGDGAGLPIAFSMSIDAGGPLAAGVGPIVRSHGAHTNTLTGALSGVAFGIFKQEFSSYEFNVDVRHCSSPCPIGQLLPNPITLEPVPEPSTIALLGSALVAALTGKLRRGVSRTT